MQISNDIKLDFDSVMLRPMTSSLNSRADVNLERTFKFKHSPHEWHGVPIIAANMDTIGTIEMAGALEMCKMLTALHKFYTVPEIARAIAKGNINPYYTAFTTGIREKDFERLEEFKMIHSGIDWSGIQPSKFIKIIMIDVPNGYIHNFFDSCKRIRQMFPEHIIMAGNVVTGDVTERLVQDCGVDVVKCGIGPGSQCETRIVTGVGYPQLSAVMETANAAHGLKGHIISDGGCKTSGDIAKALSAGSDFVMIGGMLAGHDQCGGTMHIDRDGKEFMEFYGMSSETAMRKHYGSVAIHRAPEGKTTLIPYKGDVLHTVHEILGGIRSSCAYIGAESIKEMSKRANFVRVK